jgi:hypothetical protein
MMPGPLFHRLKQKPIAWFPDNRTAADGLSVRSTMLLPVKTGPTRKSRVVGDQRTSAMKTLSILILATRIFLSLGIGTAMAQGLTPGSGEGVYLSTHHQVGPTAGSHGAGQVRSGSSDTNTSR